MVKEFTSHELTVLIDGLDRLNNSELTELINFFPFSNLVNISIINYDLMRLNLKLLKKLSQNDIFYSNAQAVKYCMEFTMANLLSLENVQEDEILFNLLEILKNMISKTKVLSGFTQNILNDRERLFNVLTLTTKLKIFGLPHVGNCTEILSELLTMNGPLPLTTSRNLAEISEIYKGLRVVYEMALICNIVIKKFTIHTEVFNVCILWLLTYGPSLLQETRDDTALLELLTVMNQFYTKYGYIKSTKKHQQSNLLKAFEGFMIDLKVKSDQIVNFCSNPILRKEGLKLFAIICTDCDGEVTTTNQNASVVLNSLMELPADVQQWPQTKSDIFFHVCIFLSTHSRLVWSSSVLISSISSLIYSYDRFSIDLILLKPLCYIYPVIMTDCLDKSTLILGDEILTILMKFPCGLNKVITYHLAQLVWILKRGERKLKKYVLGQWLKRDTDVELLGKAILQCKSGSILLDIIVDCRADQLARDKAIEMTHRINDHDLSKNIAMMIPTIRSENILHQLILSNPGMPSNTESAIKLCIFMSLVLIMITDENVLKAACSYCKYLLTNLKKENNIVIMFCEDMQNIQFLVIKLKYVNDDTAAEVLRLLKVLILVQKRNHNRIEEKVDIDLSQSLVGSPSKVEKCLDLLQIIVTSDDVFLKLEESSIQNTFLNLFQLTKAPKLGCRSFICLTNILKANRRLACAYSTNLFIEVQCSLAVDEKVGPEFVMFLQAWMKSFKQSSKESSCYVPNKMTISNYIKRAGFLCQAKVHRLLRLLGKLKINSDTFEARQRAFGQLLYR